MQYEAIILELLSRIQKLEADVELLKNNMSSQNLDADNEAEGITENNSRVAYKKMTDQMIEVCYKAGKKMNAGEDPSCLADLIVDETGMNRNSAIMYLYAVDAMLNGTIYKRAINSNATKKFFDMIKDDYGVRGLRKAIKATRAHISYRQELGHTVDSIIEICEEYERRY